jgi:DNA repair photolyase
MSREEYAQVQPRPGVLEAMKHELATGKIPKGSEVFLSFTSDPFPDIERTHKLTSQAITLLYQFGMKARILTKNPMGAMQTCALLMNRHQIPLGTTFTFLDYYKALYWEPGAPPLRSRIEAIDMAHSLGIPTWLSLEPVIHTHTTLYIIKTFLKYGCIDEWRIGHWNHDERAKQSDWREFVAEVRRLLAGKKYMLKRDLLEAAGE